jgi:hypothetical protein
MADVSIPAFRWAIALDGTAIPPIDAAGGPFSCRCASVCFVDDRERAIAQFCAVYRSPKSSHA